MASQYGHTNVVDVLLKAGADVNEACAEVLLLLLILVFIRLLIINFVCHAHVIYTKVALMQPLSFCYYFSNFVMCAFSKTGI